MDNRSRAGLLIVIGSTWFLLTWKIAEFLRPDYSVSRDVISALGVGENAWIFNLGVIVLGLLGLWASYLLSREWRLFSILLGLSSIGAIGVGLFPMDNPVPHAVSAFTAFLFSGIAAVYSYRLEGWPLSLLWGVMGIISLVALILFATDTYLGLGRGGMERMIVYPVMIWLIGFGSRLARREDSK